jgi:hypothetical protein
MDRQRVRVWLRKAYLPLDQMASALFVGPTVLEEAPTAMSQSYDPAF